MSLPYHLPDEVDRIATHPEPVLRNLQITQSYCELSAAMAGRTGRGANWCTFATWASKQAGETIRKKDLDRALQQALRDVPELQQVVAELVELLRSKGISKNAPEIERLIWETLMPAAAMERAGAAVARGNQKVYAEIGRAFARFLATGPTGPAADAEWIASYCEALRDGDPPDGQRYLRQAFTHYYRAFFAEEAKTRAELLLLANLEIGFHEQTRLQPEIAEALEAAVIDPDQFARRLLEVLFPYRAWWFWLVVLLMRILNRRTALDKAIHRFFDEARRRVRLFLTDRMMTLRFSGGRRVRLGDDLQATFPEGFQHLENAELTTLLRQIDPTPDSLAGSGAADWADLPERLHFIADMFRCYHESADLLDEPFSLAQVRTIKEGRTPEDLS